MHIYVNSTTLQLFCVTADNTSNNDTACAKIESIFHRRRIYSFNTLQHRLPCLAHVVNLGVVAIMSVITRIANVETTTAIWEFDPNDHNNHVLGNSLDVVAAVRTIAIKVSLVFLCPFILLIYYADSVFWTADRLFRDASKELRPGEYPQDSITQQCQVGHCGWNARACICTTTGMFTLFIVNAYQITSHRSSTYSSAQRMSSLGQSWSFGAMGNWSRTSHGQHLHSRTRIGSA